MNLFTPIEKNIWDKALPYQDKRDDVGHAEYVVYFAFKLLEYINAKREIVVSAAILHDVGWSKLFKASEWSKKLPNGLPLQKYEPLSEDFKKNELIYRGLHQEAGVEITKKILKEVGYPKQYIPTIVEIVSQHDTRDGFFCPEDGGVRDADKLWRFTVRQMQMPYFSKLTLEELYEESKSDIEKPNFFCFDISRQIARIELEDTFKYLKKN